MLFRKLSCRDMRMRCAQHRNVLDKRQTVATRQTPAMPQVAVLQPPASDQVTVPATIAPSVARDLTVNLMAVSGLRPRRSSVCWNGTGQECPPGWTCPELSIFGVNFPTFCCLPTGSQSQQAASCCSQRLCKRNLLVQF